jgi:hypothetical protein
MRGALVVTQEDFRDPAIRESTDCAGVGQASALNGKCLGRAPVREANAIGNTAMAPLYWASSISCRFDFGFAVIVFTHDRDLLVARLGRG